MEPRIQYAKTSDGVSIAYYVIGDGPPLIGMPGNLSMSIEFDWKVREPRAAAEAAAHAFTYVRYDARGAGLSQQDVEDLSLQAMVRDLEAVVSVLPQPKVNLFGTGFTGMAGVAFAAQHPERVERLVLWQSGTRGEDLYPGPLRNIVQMAESDWRFASEAIMHALGNWDNAEAARRRAVTMRASVEPSMYVRYHESMRDWDVTALLSQVGCPTLVIHTPENAYLPASNARRLAAGISGARLLLIDSPSALFSGDVGRAAGLFFLGREDVPTVAPRRELPQGTAVILFADIVDSTALTERLGDAAFREKARDLDGGLRTIIRENGGTPVEGKLLGDGVLAVFTSARQAIEAALACGKAGEEAGLPLHPGIHAGDVIREENNVYGGAVNIAARISALSVPGEVLVSETVRGLARTSAGVSFEDRGEQSLKGVSEPVRVWAVRSQGP